MIISWLRKKFGLDGDTFKVDPELDQVVRQIALIRRKATGFDPAAPSLGSAEVAALLNEMEGLIMPKLKVLAVYLAPYMQQSHVRNWRAEPDADWCRWFVAGEVKRLNIDRAV